MACNPNLLSASFKHLNVCKGIDMHCSGITRVSTINGVNVTSMNNNVVNIIFQQGASNIPGSNVYGDWASIVTLANQMNVNQILHIYFDDTISSPCLINVSCDFKGRTSFYSALASNAPVTARIVDGTTISNIKGIFRTLTLLCDSITTQSLAFDNNAALELHEGSAVNNTATALVPSILSNSKSLAIVLYLGSVIANSGNPAVPLLRMINGSTTILLNNFNSIPSSNVDNSIADDGTGILAVITDASWSTFPTFPSFTGTYNKQKVDNASMINYDDSKSTSFGATDVQGVLDSLKTTLTTGSITTKNTSNQIVLGTTNTTTLDSKTPASSITYSIQDQSLNCNVSLGINKIQPLSPPQTLLSQDSGSVYNVTSTGASQITLPVPTNGLKYTFIVNGPVLGYQITCQSTVLFGSLLSSDGTAVTLGNITSARTYLNINSAAVIGDKYEFYSDGQYWFVYGITANHTSCFSG